MSRQNDNKHLCKLCMELTDERIGILSDEGLRLNIDSTLRQHFGFQLESGNANSICRKCWWKIETFHDYYLRIEKIHRDLSTRIFVSNLDGKELSESIKCEISRSKEFPLRRSTRNRRRKMDGSIPYVIETEGKENDHYWEDVNAVMTSNIDTAFFPTNEEEKRNVVENIEANLFVDFVDDDDDDDDAPLIIFKEKAVKKSGEIVVKSVENDVSKYTDDSIDSFDDGEYSKADDDFDDVEQKVPPAVIVGIKREIESIDARASETATETEPKTQKSTKTSKSTKIMHGTASTSTPQHKHERKRKHKLLSSYPVTAEMAEWCKKQLHIEEVGEPSNIDYEQIRKYIKLSCYLCNEPFETFLDGQIHFLYAHQRNAVYKCCHLLLDCTYDIVEHIKFHVDSNAFSCLVCNRKFPMQSKLRHHVRRFHVPSQADGLIKCLICAKTLPVPKYLLHERRHIAFKCPHCPRNINAANVERHVKFAHTSTAKVMCDICGKVSCDRKAYRLHFAVEHSGIDQKLQCDLCGLWVKHRKQLSKHMRKHFDSPQTCKICGKITPNKYALSSHKSLHNEKKHKCQYCGKVYFKIKLLKEHESIHTGIKDLYNCDFCDKTFRFNSGMYAHRKKAHPIEYQMMQKKSYLECTFNQSK